MSDDISKPVTADTTSPQRRVPWGASSAILVAVCTYFGASILSGLLLDWYVGTRHWSTTEVSQWLNSSVTAQFIYILLTEGLTIGSVLLFMHFKHAGLRVLGWVRLRLRDIGYALGGTAVYFVLYFVVFALLLHFTHIDVGQKQDVGFQHVAGDSQLLLTFISLVILPPVVEETVFRGFLFGGLKNRMPVRVAAVLTSVLFAAPHLLESGSGGLLWVAGIDTFILSLVLCYLREKTGSLWAGVLVHMLKNGVAFYSLFIVTAR
ncbi:MAG TPA: CPBP family intramembrane glutamic endopeptidase [Candidatus Saccharimonadales bacterium]|jgi:hypothetical protein|nr:CPBP family intramembrane glutamic endopeptidase [Candidatus Saccharimonadales bacterium]